MNKVQQNFSLSKYANTTTDNNIIDTINNFLLLFFFSLNSIFLPLNKIEQLKNKISTTGLAGGLLFRPIRALYLRLSLKTHRKFANCTSFTCLAPWAYFFLLLFITGSPVNGSIYSFILIWSYNISSFSWFLMYSSIFFAFFPTVST